MTFLYPILLVLGILVAVPFIIHLFGERKYQPLSFSSLKFLREIEKESMQRLHVRQWLILLSRALLIAMLVFILASPFSGTARGRIGEGIFLIDRSLSTQEDPEFKMLENNIKEAFPRWDILEYNEKSRGDSVESNIRRSIKNNELERPHIIWVTDLQNNDQNHELLNRLKTIGENIYVLAKIKTGRNVAISEFHLFDIYNKDMNKLQIKVESKGEDQESKTVYINVNGKRLGQAGTDKSGYASYSFTKLGNNESMCSVICQDDDHAFDNQRYLVISDKLQIKLLCVIEAGKPHYHINALNAMENIILTQIEPDDLIEQNFEEYDLIWFSGLYKVNENVIDQLKNYAIDNPVLLTADKEINRDNEWFELIGSTRKVSFDRGHLILVNSEEEEFPNMKIQQYFVTDKPTEKPIWSMNNDAPLLMGTDENIFLLLSPFDFKWNEIGLSPFFTREISKALDKILKREGDALYIGDPIQLNGRYSLVTTPAGEKYRVNDTFYKTQRPGFYTIENDLGTRTVAVNLPPQECIQSEINVSDLRTIDWDGRDADSLQRQIRGRNIQSLFFILATLFIILEMLLLRKGEKIK